MILSNSIVDVIIPCFNAEKFIEETLKSVFSQTEKNVSIIIVNDGSTDNTKEILNKFKDRVLILEHKDGVNKGAPAALNLAIKKSSSPYIAFLDADDIFFKEKIKKQIEILNNKKEVGLVYTNGFAIDEKNVHLYQLFPDNFTESGDSKMLLLDNYIRTPSIVMIRRALLKETGLFCEKVKFAKDHDMWLNFAEISSIYYISEPLAGYRQHADQQSLQRNQWDEGFIVLQKACDRYPYSRTQKNKRIAVLNYRLGEHEFKNRNKLSALYYMILSFIFDPKRAICFLISKIKNY
jgi:glycosyltransferase involved in cell wall biosynthesis